MWTNIRYILITALRDWLFIGLFIGVVFAVLVSHVLASTALVEQQEMSLAFAAGSMRIILAIGLIVFVCFHIRHAFDSKEIDVILSRPVSRPQVVFSYWMGFAIVATILIILSLAVISCIGPISNTGFLSWAGSLIGESWLVVALALFAGFTLRSAVASVMATLGFYALSRMMGFFIATAESRMLDNDWLQVISKKLVHFISMIVPRLDFFSKSEWLVYGVREVVDLQLFVLQAAIFIPLILFAAIIDFNRREF